MLLDELVRALTLQNQIEEHGHAGNRDIFGVVLYFSLMSFLAVSNFLRRCSQAMFQAPARAKGRT